MTPAIRIFHLAIKFFAALLIAATLLSSCNSAFAQDVPERKVRSRVPPVYPDIARKMKLSGVVRVEVVISANGKVEETKVIGGHPILVTAAVDAVKKWKFDPASAETKGILEIKFDPNN